MSDLREEGIFIRQGKTGKAQIKRWTPRLMAAGLAMALPSKIGSMYLIHDRQGLRYTRHGFKAMWQRARKKAAEQLACELDFTFHDIKAKSISDYAGDKQRFSGHKTASQVAVYDRKPEIVGTLDVSEYSNDKKA